MVYSSAANQEPFLRILSRQQQESLHAAVLVTLEDVGSVILCEQARQLLKDAGALVSGERVKIPPLLLERALQTVPPGFALYDRKGGRKLFFEGYNSYFGPGPSTTYTVDPYSGERRLPCKDDTRKAARVMDGLENIDFVMDFGTIQDVPTRCADLHLLQAMLENTSKPLVHWGFDAHNCQSIIDICSIVAGGREELQRQPFIALFSCSNSPLMHTRDALEKLIFTAKSNIPFIYVSAPSAGATTPVTLAGTLVVTLAECLCGLVVHQLVAPGAPFAIGGVTGATDMQTMSMSYGCPEFNLMHAALADMAHYYQLPLWGTAGCTDSKKLDEQAAAEATASIMMSAMSGINMIHDVGYMEGGNTSNLGMLVLCDEIIGYTRRLNRGVHVDEESLALEAIKGAGPMGEYVTAEHTYNNFKRELWFPTLMDRQPFNRWKAEGGKTMGEKAMARARELIAISPLVELDRRTREKIAEIISAASS